MVEASATSAAKSRREYAALFPEPVRLRVRADGRRGRAIGVILADRLLARPQLDDAERHLLWTLGKAAALASVARIVATQARERRTSSSSGSTSRARSTRA